MKTKAPGRKTQAASLQEQATHLYEMSLSLRQLRILTGDQRLLGIIDSVRTAGEQLYDVSVEISLGRVVIATPESKPEPSLFKGESNGGLDDLATQQRNIHSLPSLVQHDHVERLPDPIPSDGSNPVVGDSDWQDNQRPADDDRPLESGDAAPESDLPAQPVAEPAKKRRRHRTPKAAELDTEVAEAIEGWNPPNAIVPEPEVEPIVEAWNLTGEVGEILERASSLSEQAERSRAVREDLAVEPQCTARFVWGDSQKCTVEVTYARFNKANFEFTYMETNGEFATYVVGCPSFLGFKPQDRQEQEPVDFSHTFEDWAKATACRIMADHLKACEELAKAYVEPEEVKSPTLYTWKAEALGFGPMFLKAFTVDQVDAYVATLVEGWDRKSGSCFITPVPEGNPVATFAIEVPTEAADCTAREKEVYKQRENLAAMEAIRQWRFRWANGDAEPRWGEWFETTVWLHDVVPVKVLCDTYKPGQTYHLKIWGPIHATTGFRDYHLSPSESERAREQGPIDFITDLVVQLNSEARSNIAKSRASRSKSTQKELVSA